MKAKRLWVVVILIIFAWCFVITRSLFVSKVFGAGAKDGLTTNNETLKIADFSLWLNGCQLFYHNRNKTGKYNLAFPGRCRFSRDATGRIRIVSGRKGKIVLVESTSSERSNCVTYIRAIVISATDIRLSKQTQQVASPPGVWDEKLYHILSVKTIAL